MDFTYITILGVGIVSVYTCSIYCLINKTPNNVSDRTFNDVISKLNKCVVQINPLMDGQDAQECCICLQDYSLINNITVRLPCNHIYHYLCILRWLKNTQSCPLCKTNF